MVDHHHWLTITIDRSSPLIDHHHDWPSAIFTRAWPAPPAPQRRAGQTAERSSSANDPSCSSRWRWWWWWLTTRTCPCAGWGRCHLVQRQMQAVSTSQPYPPLASQGNEAPVKQNILELWTLFCCIFFLHEHTLPRNELKPSARTQVPSPWKRKLDF